MPTELGPKMLALASDQARRFAWLMACGARSATAAAKAAGYSDVKDGAKVRAHELMHNPKVVEAIAEASRSVLLGLAPAAIMAAKRILADPKHPGHSRMVEAVLDRTGFSAKTEHKVTVEHTADLRELEDFARRLAAETGVSADRFLGVNAPSSNRLEKINTVIEHDKGEVVDGEQAAGAVEAVQPENSP